MASRLSTEEVYNESAENAYILESKELIRRLREAPREEDEEEVDETEDNSIIV